MIQHATQDADSIRVPTNDERRAAWAGKYFGAGYHRIGTYRSKYPRVPNCPQNDELDERTPAPHTTKPVREAGKGL